MEIYEEKMEKVEIMEDDVFVEEKDEKFSDKVKRHWKSFANNPVSGTQKMGLIIGAIMLGGLMEKYHGLRDKQLLDEEIVVYKEDKFGRMTNEAVKMTKRELLNGVNKTHSVSIEPIEKMETYKEFKRKKN